MRIKNKNLSSRFINWNSTKEKFHLVKSSVSCVFSKGCSAGGRGCFYGFYGIGKGFGQIFVNYSEKMTLRFSDRHSHGWGVLKLGTVFGGWKVSFGSSLNRNGYQSIPLPNPGKLCYPWLNFIQRRPPCSIQIPQSYFGKQLEKMFVVRFPLCNSANRQLSRISLWNSTTFACYEKV